MSLNIKCKTLLLLIIPTVVKKSLEPQTKKVNILL